MLIRKATGEEMLALWGYPDAAAAPPTARFFYDNISGGNAVFLATMYMSREVKALGIEEDGEAH